MTEPTIARIAVLEAELAAVRAEMQEFTAAVSHDLRAPLRHIVSFVRLVQEDAGPHLGTEVQGFLDTIADSARHMGTLLDGLSALSRLGTVPINLTPVSLDEVVARAVESLQQFHSEPPVEWQIAPDLPVVSADEELLRQALVHVLGNAVKFSGSRKPPVIRVTSVADEGMHGTVLEIRDNGVGFSPAGLPRLFQVFGRLHSAGQFDGIGMGLVLTQRIMQRLGGSVTAQAEVDNGCCVRLHLPAPEARMSQP